MPANNTPKLDALFSRFTHLSGDDKRILTEVGSWRWRDLWLLGVRLQSAKALTPTVFRCDALWRTSVLSCPKIYPIGFLHPVFFLGDASICPAIRREPDFKAWQFATRKTDSQGERVRLKRWTRFETPVEPILCRIVNLSSFTTSPVETCVKR